MQRIISQLFRIYTIIPYLYLGMLIPIYGIFCISSGNVIPNDGLFDMAPLKIMAMACVAGIFLYPLVAFSGLIYNRKNWKKLLLPVFSYGLYICSVALAGYMGWWTD